MGLTILLDNIILNNIHLKTQLFDEIHYCCIICSIFTTNNGLILGTHQERNNKGVVQKLQEMRMIPKAIDLEVIHLLVYLGWENHLVFDKVADLIT